MSEVDLDAIEARLNAAVPGPWKAEICEPCAERGREDRTIWDESGTYMVASWSDGDVFNQETIDFIAHSREDIAALLEKVRDLQERVEEILDEKS